jgi:hypothetical protein
VFDCHAFLIGEGKVYYDVVRDDGRIPDRHKIAVFLRFSWPVCLLMSGFIIHVMTVRC